MSPDGDNQAVIDHIADRGRVTWHTSDPDGGTPDVGISLGLGGGRAIFAGEITSDRWQESAAEIGHLGDDTGWWLIVYPGGEPVAKFACADDAQRFMDLIEGLVTVPR